MDLARILRPLRRAISSIVARGVVLLVDDSGSRQIVQLQLLADEIHSGVEHFQPLGLSSVPMPPDASGAAEAAALFAGGARSHGIVAVIDDRRYRPKGEAPGTTTIYTPAGVAIRCKADGSVEIMGTDVSITASGSLSLAGDDVSIDASGELSLSGASGVSIDGPPTTIDGKPFLPHTHGGVTSGGSQTSGVT